MKKDERLNFSDRTPSVRRLVVSLVLMLLAVLPAAAQNKKITVDLDNVPVREFIKTVESQSGYTFAYNNSEIDLSDRNGQNDFGRARHRRQRNRLGDQPGQRHRS